MLKKSPLKYPVTRSASEISPNIIVNRSKRDLSEARIVKISFIVFFSQKRITVKKGEDAKEQHLKLVNDVAVNEEERFLNFNKFTDRLDTFYANLLPFHDFATV